MLPYSFSTLLDTLAMPVSDRRIALLDAACADRTPHAARAYIHVLETDAGCNGIETDMILLARDPHTEAELTELRTALFESPARVLLPGPVWDDTYPTKADFDAAVATWKQARAAAEAAHAADRARQYAQILAARHLVAGRSGSWYPATRADTQVSSWSPAAVTETELRGCRCRGPHADDAERISTPDLVWAVTAGSLTVLVNPKQLRHPDELEPEDVVRVFSRQVAVAGRKALARAAEITNARAVLEQLAGVDPLTLGKLAYDLHEARHRDAQLRAMRTLTASDIDGFLAEAGLCVLWPADTLAALEQLEQEAAW